MSTITEQFEAAQVAVKNLSEKPGNFDLLALYANFKQATDGDVGGDKPGMFDLVAKKKYEAWEKIKGLSADDAMKGYIAEVERLLNED